MGTPAFERLARMATLGVSSLAGGCAGAPSIAIVGAYFPAWLCCALIGVLAALAARVAFVMMGLAQSLPFPLFVCGSIGAMAGVLVWLAWVGL